MGIGSLEMEQPKFWLRLALAYAVVPWTAPTLYTFFIFMGGQRLAFLDISGIIALYAVFSFAAMLILGAPLIFLYSRRDQARILAFVLGGGVCAAATYVTVARQQIHLDLGVLFTIFGLVEGLILRVILFGFGKH